MKMDFHKYHIGFLWNFFICIILACSVAGNIPRIDRARALAKKNQLATKIQTSGPSLVNIFKLLEPDRKNVVPKQRTTILLKPNIIKPLPNLQKNANFKVPVNKQKFQKTARIVQNRGLPIAKNKIKMPLPMRPKQLPAKKVNSANKMSLPVRQIPLGAKKQLPVKKVNLLKSPYYSPKRQQLWFPGQNIADAASLRHIQEGLEHDYQVQQQQSLINQKDAMPVYPSTNKKLDGYYETALDRIHGGRPRAMPSSFQKPAATKVTGYTNKNMMAMNANNLMASPYVDLTMRPLSETAAYLRHLQRPVAINAMPHGVVARQSASLKPASVHMPITKAVSKIDKTARRTIDQKYVNGVVRSNSEGTRANSVNNDVLTAVGPAISRWDKIEQGQKERWRDYQRNKGERWKEYVTANDNTGNIESRMTSAKGPAIPQELDPTKRFNGRHNAVYESSPSNLRSQSEERHSQLQFARRTKPSQDSYDYKAKAKTNENFNFDSNTQELLPGSDPAAGSLCDSEKCDSEKNRKFSNQNKVVSLEVVDNAEVHREEPSKGVVKPKIPTGGNKETPFGKPDENAEKQGKPLNEQKQPGKGDFRKPNNPAKPDKTDKTNKPTEKQRKPEKPVGELGKSDKPSGEFGKPDKPFGELGKPDKPNGEFGKPDKPVGELGKPDKSYGEFGKPDKPFGELGKPDKPNGGLGKPDKPFGELGKPDKPNGEFGKPDKPVGEPGKPDKPNGEFGKPDKPFGELGKPDKPNGEFGKPDKPFGELGKPDKPNGEFGKPDKPFGELGKPDKPFGELGKPDKPNGEFGKPDKPVGEPGKPDKPSGELGKPDKPVGEPGKPDKPYGEFGKPDKPFGELGKPDKPVGELGKPDKPVGEKGKPGMHVGDLGKPDKPVGEPGEPEKPTGEPGKPDKPVGELGKPDKPVGQPGESDRPTGEPGKPDKPVGELGKPDKPPWELGKPDKPVGELGKPDKPAGELGKPDKPAGEFGKPDKPFGELGKPDKPAGEPGEPEKPDKPVGEPWKPDKPVGEIGKPDKPIGEPGQPEKPVGELGKPDKPVGEPWKPDKPIGELGQPEKPVGELGKPDKPVGEPGQPEKPVGEIGKPDKPIGEPGKPEKPIGELGKPDKPVGEPWKPDKPVGGIGKPDKPIGEPGQPEKPVGELGKPDKPVGEPGQPEKPVGEIGKPDKPIGEPGQPEKPVGELGKPDKPVGEPGQPEKPVGELGKPDKPIGEPGQPEKPVGEIGKPDKPIGEPGQPEKPVGEIGKPDKPIGEPGQPEKPVGEIGKPDKPIGEPGQPEKPVGEIGKPDKPIGEPGQPEKPVGEIGKPDKPIGEPGQPEKPVGEIGKPDKPIGEPGQPEKPVGEIGKPDKPVGEPGQPEKPVGEIGKPDKPIGEPGQPEKPVGEIGKPDKPVGEPGQPEKPVGEIGKPDKPIGEPGQPEKPVGEIGKPDKPIGEPGQPEKPVGEIGKPDKPIRKPGKPDKPVGGQGKPNKCKPKKPIKPVKDDGCPLKQGCSGYNPCPEFIPSLYENGAGPTLSVPQKPDVDRPPETPSRLLEEALLNQMEQRLASVLSLMQYVGGLHTIEMSSSGCDYPLINGDSCDKSMASIIVDGEQVSDDNIGFNIAVLDYPSFAVKAVKSFNTNMDVISQQMAAFLMSISKKNLLLVAVKGDVVGAVSQEVWDALTLFGARPPFEKRRRSSFAFIGCRSGCQVPWIQQVQRPPSHGPSNIQLIIGSRNQEYISFGGSGQTVDDVIRSGTKPSTTMSVGYNAGLPAQFFARPINLEDQSRSSSSEPSSQRLQDIADLRKAGRHGLEQEVLSPFGRGLQRESRDQDKNTELERAGYRISPGERFGSQRRENAKEDRGNEQKNIDQDALSIPIEAEADNEPFSEDPVSFKPQAPETVADLKLQEHNTELKQESNDKHRKDINFETKQKENANVGNLELLKEKYSDHIPRESKQSAQFRQPEIDSRYNSHAKAAQFDGLESADNPNLATRKNNNDRKPGSAVSPMDRARYVGPLRTDKTMPQAERTNFRYQGGNARGSNEDRLSSQPDGYFIDRRPKEHADFASNTDGQRFNDGHGYGSSSKPIQGNRESYNGEQTLKNHRDDSKSAEAIDKQSASFQVSRNQELVNKGENMPIERADRLTFIKAGSADRQETFRASPAMGKHDSQYERLQPEAPDEKLCKHCDVKPEVSFKLEESAVGQNPKIQCQGCNKDFEPAVDSMKFDMAVASDKISPNSWKPMKDEPSKISPPGAANKMVANSQKMPGEDRASMLQAEGEKVDPNVCKHCDVKPEVSFKLQGSALESDPKKYQCKGCNKDFKPAVDNIKFDMSMAGDKISPNSWKNMKDQPNVKPFRGIPKEMPLGVEADDHNYNKVAGKRVGFSSSSDGRRQQKDAESSGSVNKQPERYEQAGAVNSYTHSNEAADQRERAGTASNGLYGNNNEKPAKPDQNTGHSVQSYQEAASQKQVTARQSGNENTVVGQQRQGHTSSENQGKNSPSDKIRGNGEQRASGNERPTNNPSLVDVVNKGMMALRESSFDIKLGENNNVNINRGSKDASQQQPEGRVQRIEQHQQLHEGRNQHEQNEPLQQRPKQEQFVKQSPTNLMNELREPNQPETDNHEDTTNAHENKKVAWHERDCDPNTENCEKLATFLKHETNPAESKLSSQDEGSLSKSQHKENSPSQEMACKRFFALPERSKKKLHKKEIARYKKNCLPKTPQETDALRLLAMNIIGKGPDQKDSPQDSHLDSSIIASAAAVKATNSGFHPGYTTIDVDVSPEKKIEEMPDTTETFISRAGRPDFSTLPGENPSKTSDMSFYFNHKNNQNEKSLLYRANPIGKEDRIITDGSNNIYDQGDIIGAAESLLQKDYSMAFNEATSALNRRVDDEQLQLNNQRTSQLSKRMLKKPKLSKQQPLRSSKPNTAVRRLQRG